MLYLLLKNVNHSPNTVFSESPRSYHSGMQSSGFKEDFANARDGSLPAKTAQSQQLPRYDHAASLRVSIGTDTTEERMIVSSMNSHSAT